MIPTSIAATASLVLSPLCCRIAPIIGAMDVPRDGRRMHTRPLPRAGGLALFPAVFISLSLGGSPLLAALLLGGVIIFVIGVSDDLRSLSPTGKLCAQSLAAAVTLAAGDDLLIPTGYPPAYFIFAFLWIVLLTNAFNLIDGLDGLCAGVGAVASSLIFLLGGGVEGAVIAAALLGFLPMNRYPAKMFLGDSGAMLIGYLLSVLTLPMLTGGARGFFAMAAILALPLLDTLCSFLRRAAAGRSPFSPDKGHFHHRLITAGLSHPSASYFLITVAAACGSLGALIFYTGLSAVTVICAGLLVSSCGCIFLLYILSATAHH